MKVLVVDDNPTSRELLKEILLPEGHSVVEAVDGVEALKILRRKKVDAILSDILMPRMDGYALCGEVRADEQLRQVPFIFYATGYTARSDEAKALAVGADKFVHKSQPASELLAALREVSSAARPLPARAAPPPEYLMKEYNQKLVERLKEVNTELNSSNQELLLKGTALDTIANGVVITDVQGTILWVNPAFSALTGYSRDEAIGQNPRLLKSGRHGAEYYRNLWTTLLEGRTWRGNFINRRKDGSLYHDEHTITPVRGDDGRITHFVAIMNDLTEQKRAENLVRESEGKFRLLAENISDVFWVSSPNLDKIYYVSPAYERIWGRRAEELYANARQRVDSILPEDRARAIAAFEALGRNDPSVSVEYRIARPDGTIRWIHDRGFQTREASGRVERLIGIAADITEGKRAETATKRLAAIVKSSDDAIIGKDLQGIVTSWNSGAEKVFGYTASEMVGSSITRLIPPERQAEENVILEKIRRGENVEHFETERLRKDGRRLNISVTVSPIKDAAGRITGASKVARDITAWKKAEQALVESDALNRGVLNSIFAHIAVLDRAGTIIAVNDAWSAFARENNGGERGLPARTQPGTNYLDICRGSHGENAEEAGPTLEGVEAVLRGERGNFTMEYPCHWRSQKRWFLLSATPLKTKNGGAVVSHLDITARKLAEEQILWRTALFEAQLHSAPDGILVVDNNAKKIVQNQRFVDMWDVPLEIAEQTDDRGELGWVTGHVKSPQPFAEKVAYLYAHPDEVSRDEIELLNGKTFDRYSAPVRGTDAKYYGRIWTFRDITEQKRAAEQIAEQAALLDKARDAIVVRDLEGNIVFWNQGAERLYGWTRQEVIGRNIGGLLYTDPKKFKECNDLTIRQGEWHGELIHLNKGKRELNVEARWTLIRDNEGRPKSVLAINTDVTEKKKIEAQFMRAQRMESIGTLAGGIAHDLNNILAPIMMSIDILKTTSDNPQTKTILETIEVSAQRGADIVRQVLSFARGLEGERIEIQPRHLIKDFEKIIRDTFPKDIHLHFSIPRDTWTILGDPTQVHQVLLNLCVNARDAMPNGGQLTIGVENQELDAQYTSMTAQAKPGRYVMMSVTDTGTGIPRELVEKIFEPFFTTKPINKGTGLGLSTVMAIVKSHGGITNVYSEPGKGTTFKVYLPASDASAEGHAPAEAQATLPRGNGEIVLIVDDEASVLTITSQTLHAFGYRFLTATDGADAVAIYAQHRDEIAVVLTDMMMPVMDGPATIHALMRINPAVKIVAASGLGANGGVAKVSGGVRHFLTKPYTAGTLLRTLRAILDEPARANA